MDEPLFFISHKHSDTKIARALANFIEERSTGRVKVFLSSSPEFEGPKFGKSLNAQLRETLWNADILVLLYTSEDQDWQYCMWECGVATHPQSPNTSIIVFQCGTAVPAPFQDVLRVNVRNYEDIKRFTDQFLREPDFFPKLKQALAPSLRDSHVESAAQNLYEQIGAVLPPPDQGLVEEWSTWPFLRVELPRLEVQRIEQASEGDRVKLASQIVREYGVVVDSDTRAAQLFGQAAFPHRMRFDALRSSWQSKYPDRDAVWFDSCCEQIMTGAARGFPLIRWTPIREVDGDCDYTPVLSRIRYVPFSGVAEFDLHFYNLADPRAIPVATKMIPSGEFFCTNLGQIDPKKYKLTDLLAELKSRALNRVPVLNDQGHPLYIIHRSMIDKFIVEQMLSGAEAASPNNLMLDNLLANGEMKDLFEQTFVVVKLQATLAEAKAAMLSRPGCSDVFVTADGTANEPVRGWLTNVDITRVA